MGVRSGAVPRGVVALLLGMAVFGVFALTAGPLAGYEPETAAVAQGLVQTGQLREVPRSPIAEGQGLVGRGGRLYSRTGIAQPLLEAPFYFVGWKFDELSSGGRGYRWRDAVLRLYSPVMAAVAVVAIFLLLLLRGVMRRRALVVALLAAVCTLVWPYSKIGMDTTLMALLAVALLAAAWAAARPTARRYALAGVAAGAAAAAKPYGAVVMFGALPLLVFPLARLGWRERAWLAGWFVLAVVPWVVVILWYNAYRTGSITDFADSPYLLQLLATPINALGLFLSPGRGLLFYSPLVILGLLGMRQLWRQDRPLAMTIVLTVMANTLVVATTAQWSDETWGPRYLVPSAWLLVLPIAWWARGRSRVRALAVVALVGAFVQLVGVFAPYSVSIVSITKLSGERFLAQPVPYGEDASRWIPQASPLLIQTEVLLASVKERLTGMGFVTTYTPIEGRPATIDLRHPQQSLHLRLPDFWWHYPGQTAGLWTLAALLAMLAVGAGTALSIIGRARPPSRVAQRLISRVTRDRHGPSSRAGR